MRQLELLTNQEYVLLKPSFGLDKDMATKKHHILARCYDKKGKLLSLGLNSYTKSHPLMKYFAAKVGHSEHKIYLHAEIDAILRARNKSIYRIVVERFNSKGLPVLAKPCPVCEEAIRAFGVKLVEHT